MPNKEKLCFRVEHVMQSKNKEWQIQKSLLALKVAISCNDVFMLQPSFHLKSINNKIQVTT